MTSTPSRRTRWGQATCGRSHDPLLPFLLKERSEHLEDTVVLHAELRQHPCDRTAKHRVIRGHAEGQRRLQSGLSERTKPLEDSIVKLGGPQARLQQIKHRPDGFDRAQLREQIDGVEGRPSTNGPSGGISSFPARGGIAVLILLEGLQRVAKDRL